MAGPEVIERLIAAAFKQSGDRLELRQDRAAVMVRGAERLRAGAIETNLETLVGWWREVAPPDLALPEAGGDGTVSAELDRGGRPVTVKAWHEGDGLALDLLLDVTSAAPVEEAEPPPATATATSPPAPGATAVAPARALDRPLDRLLAQVVARGASDLHLSSGVAPMLRVSGEIVPVAARAAPLESDHILLMCEEIAPASKRREFRTANDTDFAYEIEGLARFRVNMFRDRRGVGVVFRQIPEHLLSMAELGVPECVRELCQLSKGLVLVTGPTGSGKSTTLAAILDHINQTRSDHVITIEDPIEFVHDNKRCLINQREVYSHTGSFKRALRAALREDPDIVLVGEMRDLETMAIAIETAETGHLVFGTLHTATAASTVDRIIDQYPTDRQEQIRMMLSDSLKGVIAQTLCRRSGGGRVAAFEILLGIPAVSHLIREGKSHQLQSIMQTNRRVGMRCLNDSLAELVRDGVIEAGEALLRAVDKDGLRALLAREAPEEAEPRPGDAGPAAKRGARR